MVLKERRLSVTSLIQHGQAPRLRHTHGGRRLDHGHGHPLPAARDHRSALRARVDARTGARAAPGQTGSASARVRPGVPRAFQRPARHRLQRDGARPQVRHLGHGAGQAGSSRRLSALPRPGGVPDRLDAGAVARRLGVPDLPRLDGPGNPGPGSRRGPDTDPWFRPLRLQPHSGPDRPAVHAPGNPADPRRRVRLWRETQGPCPTVAMAFVGDGGTSEGDFHEALNFAAVFNAPVVFLVQNNKYAISDPLSKQTAAPSLGYKGIGYGIVSEQVDGNDVMAVLAVLNKAVAHARSGQGPVLV